MLARFFAVSPERSPLRQSSSEASSSRSFNRLKNFDEDAEELGVNRLLS